MSTTVLTASASPQWIISKRDDLFWFIGGGLLGYVALGGMLAGFPIAIAYLIWNLMIDGPHLWATVTRTYLDKSARGWLSWRLWSIIPFALIGPLVFAFGFGKAFTLVFLTWAGFHIAKQHFGFVMLYKRKNGERSDVALDKRFIVTTFLLPWGIFLLNFYDVSRLTLVKAAIALSLLGYVTFLGFYVKRQIERWQSSEANTPKLMLLMVIVPLQWIAYICAMGREDGALIAAIAINMGHSFQYHRLTWFHNQNRYEGQTKNTIGLAALINSRWTFFFLTAFLLNILTANVVRHYVSSEIVLASLMGINMTHFYLDSFIWRVRGDKELAHALRL